MRLAISIISRWSHALSALAARVLSACDTPALDQGSPSSKVTIKRSTTAGPGTDGLSPSEAANTFRELCVDQRPRFKGTESVAARRGFVQNTRFGTYYHPSKNLSVKLIDGKCSIVFTSKAPASKVTAVFNEFRQFGLQSKSGRETNVFSGHLLFNFRI